jgi:hypothetical protein
MGNVEDGFLFDNLLEFLFLRRFEVKASLEGWLSRGLFTKLGRALTWNKGADKHVEVGKVPLFLPRGFFFEGFGVTIQNLKKILSIWQQAQTEPEPGGQRLVDVVAPQSCRCCPLFGSRDSECYPSLL